MPNEVLYRANSDEHELVAVLCETAPGICVVPATGQVTDVYIDGVGVRFSDRVSLPLGGEVQLELRSPHDGRPIVLTSLVRDRHDAAEFRRYGFRFTNPEEVADQLPQGLHSLFNRRRAERFQLSSPIATWVLVPGHEALSGHVTGASKYGCSIIVGPDSEHLLTDAERLTVRLDQEPSCDRSRVRNIEGRTLDLIVRNRMLLTDRRVRYGCEFADAENEESRESRQRFLDDLLARDRELRRAHTA